MEENNILGVVLAGGKSRRFGEDKNHIMGFYSLIDVYDFLPLCGFQY